MVNNFGQSGHHRKEVEIMKMFLFCYPDYLDDAVSSEFKQAGYKSYMKLHSATGKDYDPKQRSHHVAGYVRALSTGNPGEHRLLVYQSIRKEDVACRRADGRF